MPEKILIVEDEKALQETLAYSLTHEGYETSIAGDGNLAISLAREIHPDLILLDIMLPGKDGFEVCRVLRQEMNTPILMLTAREEEIDRVVGLEVGADDYMTKPFSMRELMARVKAMLRRVRLIREEIHTADKVETEKEEIRSGNMKIDLKRREALLNDKALELKPKEYDLLLYFMQHQARALSRDAVLEQVWGWNFTGDSRTVDVHIRWLREKIEVDPSKPLRIVTIRGSGYRFEG
jgi:DNA-binding response OmpR family regulator